MAENIVTNANDVELVLERDGTKAGTEAQYGRIVVDDFSLTREEDDSLISGVGHRLPVGVTKGDITFGWDFTLLGSDKEVFDMISTTNGESNVFSFTARKLEDDGSLDFEFALDTCLTTSEEYSGSSGDATEYAVEGIAVSYENELT